MSRFRAFGFLLVAILTPATPTAAADPPTAAKKATQIPHIGYVSPDEKTIYVVSRGGNDVEAIEIETGKVCWTNTDAKYVAGATDTLVFGNRLDESVKTPAFRLVAIDTATGKTTVKSDPIDMPEWAKMETVGAGRRTHWQVVAETEQGRVLVLWRAKVLKAGGIRVEGEWVVSDIAAVDLKTGKVSVLDRKPTAEQLRSGNLTATYNVGGWELSTKERMPAVEDKLRMRIMLTAKKEGKQSVDARGCGLDPARPAGTMTAGQVDVHSGEVNVRGAEEDAEGEGQAGSIFNGTSEQPSIAPRVIGVDRPTISAINPKGMTVSIAGCIATRKKS